ncbi:MAG TPA: type IV toxin-antitoxin system AbiEi family antitoxin domain-containing protein [Gammaproteobacteria bacterium]|nr:type IV toxin-antitoxin system AbiEi family antitoxin domain-containing protein [Gammaproteobacteria bacterium]
MTSQSATQEQQVLALARRQPLLRARDVTARGLATVTLSRLVAAGKLERVARGVYSLPDQAISAHRSLAEVAIRVPRGVICLLSALRVHEIGTQSPIAVWLAIPHNVPPPRLRRPKLRVVRMSGAAFSEGIVKIDVEGVRVSVFNPAKTVADCFKYRNKIGLDVALEALSEAWRARLFNMDELWRYAMIDRVQNVMRPYLEALSV